MAADGDWGATVVDVMAAGPDAPAELIGIHSTFPGVFPDAIEKAIQTHGELPPDLSAAERRAVETLTNALSAESSAMPPPGSVIRGPIAPTVVTSSPSRIETVPRPMTIRQ